MAIIHCYECNAEISTQAKRCPQCGAKMNYKNSKSVLGAALLAFFFPGLHYAYLHKNCWGSAIGLFILFIIVSVLTSGLGAFVLWLIYIFHAITEANKINA